VQFPFAVFDRVIIKVFYQQDNQAVAFIHSVLWFLQLVCEMNFSGKQEDPGTVCGTSGSCDSAVLKWMVRIISS
jgi:hypothetical protein